MVEFKQYIPITLLVLLAVLSFFIIKPLLAALFLGALFAYAFNPLYKLLRKKINKTISALIICVIVFIIIFVPGVYLIESLVRESYTLFTLVKQKMAVGIFRSCENQFCVLLEDLGSNSAVSSQVKILTKGTTEWIVAKGSAFLISLPRTLLNLFVIFFTMFYFLKDGPKLLNKISDILSMKQKKYSYVMGRLKDVLHGVIYGYLLVALIQGAFGALGFYMFGISSPLFWGLVMSFLALIPYLGTGVIWMPAALILFLDGFFSGNNVLTFKGVGLFLYGLIVISGSDNLLRPKLMGHKAKIHPAVILLGILGGALVFGMLGVFIGPIILSLTLILIDTFFYKKDF
jgi:predicted PurR-regulated permease PerM